MRNRLLLALLVFLIIPISSADTQGLLYSGGMYIEPWAITGTDPGINSQHLATSSGYFQSLPYTETQWTTYWNLVCDDFNDMNIDVVYLMVGTEYFEAKRQNDPTIEPGWEKIGGNQARYLWYSGDGWLNWTIDTAHDHDIKILLWQAINKINNDDYIGAINNDNYKAKGRYTQTGPNPTLTVSTYRLDYSSSIVRALYCDQIGYAVSVTPELDGVHYEEPYMYFTGGSAWGYAAYPSYGDPSVDRYIELYGSSPLTVTETETVFLRMADINIEGLNLFMAELQTSIMANTSKTYPEFVLSVNAFEWKATTDRYLDVTNWSDNEYVEMYVLQRGLPTTEALREYYQSTMADNYPNIACSQLIPISDITNPALAPYIFPCIASSMTYGGHIQSTFAYWSVVHSYESVTIRSYLTNNPPPEPTYNDTQDQNESPISNPDVSFSNNIKKTSPDSIFSTYLEDVSFLEAGSILTTTSYRSYIHGELEIPGSQTNTTIQFTLQGKHATMTDDTVIELFNASNSTNQISWSTNHTTWNNYTLNGTWGAAGGDWYDLNGDLRGNVPICSFTVGVDDPVGTQYDCNITTLAQNATDGINLLMKSPNETEVGNYVWFYAENTANSSNRPLVIFDPSGANAPNITTQWNNITGDDDLSILFQLPGSIEFGATANQTVDRWYWSVNDILKSETTSNFSSDILGIANHTVSVYCENNSITSTTITWDIEVTGLIDYPPGTPENTSVTTGIGFINVSWDTNKTNNNVSDTYLIIDEDSDQQFYTTDLFYNLTGLLAKEYNLTLYSVNETNSTTTCDGYNFQDYPKINTTNEWYNHTSSSNKTVTVYVRAYNSTYDIYSDWVSASADVPAGVDTKFEYWTGSAWVEDEAQYYLWFDCFWYTSSYPDGVAPNAEQSDSQPSLKIINNGTGSGVAKMKLNESAPANIKIYVDDDNSFADSIELTDYYQTVSTTITAGNNVTVWAWVNLTGPTDIWDYETYAIIE